MTAAAFDPQAGYVVTASTAFISFNDQTFATFYQPILGPVAFSFFYALKARLLPNPTIANRTLQSDLLAQVNAGGRQVLEALHRLEAVGLVQTYFQHDEIGDVYVYELQPTLTPEKFLADNLLSILLLEEVGEDAFGRLTKQSRQYKLASSNTSLTNVSHNFFEEFHINSQSITETPQAILTARKQAPVEKQPQLTAGMSDDFDWSTLIHLLANQPIVSADLENNFNPKKFKQIVASTYNIVYSSTTKVAEKEAPVTNRNSELTSKDQELLATAKDYSPVEFLQVLKGQTGGYVTSGERHILTGLVAQEKLTQDAINILTWYVISDRGNSTLTANFVDAIANNWLQHGVINGEQAIVQLKIFNKQSQEKKKETKTPKKNKWRKTIKEPMPAWSKKDTSELMKKASSQEIAKLRERIANRKK